MLSTIEGRLSKAYYSTKGLGKQIRNSTKFIICKEYLQRCKVIDFLVYFPI
ncbi:hypothetical protein HMPREF9378_2121 [Streptococcus sanguinis SK1 = NCTC 7863]|uniref:Uncharacterized protein n=1 Tax=Streptococcus sanguinis SK408 TaxID=888818 RepID=F2CHT8_STRSA|nr:hypothetical protein HMPREF9378_2121 [Streptococcus sanguinis SK1 = NCTC 7863]EGF17028.1 hypothetical protein HMPREF9391_2354 [Streptococcus sanguinis SK408]EGF22102.1 hypothetical protein HMPREF9395_0533 [Streptococcus sanguinis SK1058]